MNRYSKLILLADDDPEDREVMEFALFEHDPTVRVVSVEDGRQAVNHLTGLWDQTVPDLIILDYRMPFLTAPEILKKINENSRYILTPKIVWSTYSDETHRIECLYSGAIAYFVKPTTVKGLQEIVATMFKILSSVS